MQEEIKRLLPLVQKPARYTGGELNQVIKNKDEVDIRFAFCFPDSYEIGMSHLGIKILYSLINAREDSWCERVFAPWHDMEQAMRENGVPLWALESGDYIRDFDVIAFTLMYELCYTNVLNMLDLAGVPLRSEDRQSLTPVIMAGGACACNAEPISDFVDLFLIGDGEEVLNEVTDLLKECKKNGACKAEFLRRAAQIQGVYVPSLYDVSYKPDGTIDKISPKDGAPEKVHKRNIADLDTVFFPDKFVVPYIDTVMDRTTAEIFRGCIRGCRFCQACFLYRPIREKSPEIIDRDCRSITASSGYDEVSLCSLSTSDYTHIRELLTSLLSWSDDDMVNLSLPSLRIDNFPGDLQEKLADIRRSGLTFAPEAGTQRLRDVINKNINEHDILTTSRQAFAGGWTSVKTYFMIGLPTETDEDVAGIAALSQKIVDEYYRVREEMKQAGSDTLKGKPVNVSASVASFVPKPFTPFQWEPQDTQDELKRKQELLRNSLTTKKVALKMHNTDTSWLEGVICRGDRRLNDVIYAAWESGCRFDSWEEYIDTEKWRAAFEKCGVDPAFYANRRREYDEVLPWNILDYGVTKRFLINEDKLAHQNKTTPNCREKCSACGAAKLNGGKCEAMPKTECGMRNAECGIIRSSESSKAHSYPQHNNDQKPYDNSEFRIPNSELNTTPLSTLREMPKVIISSDIVRTARLYFSKTGSLRYISHLDTMRAFSRAIRRTDIPVWYTEGFNPKPHLNFLAPLPLGVEGLREPLEIRLVGDITDEELTDKFNAVLPDGLRINEQCAMCNVQYTDKSEDPSCPERARDSQHPTLNAPIDRSEIAFGRYEVTYSPDVITADELAAALGSGKLICEKPGKVKGRRVMKQVSVSDNILSSGISAGISGMTLLRIAMPCGDTKTLTPVNLDDALSAYTGRRIFAEHAVRTGIYTSDGRLF
ncbi:MAG: TIGR03960 family B12-binding radical SAM protein [Clostridia bacterium]|nr:TIGR03960 family B12-binding radical SAM protein [Clostridia bacterium]